MSSDPPDTNTYLSAYKTALYDNLLVGIVYGRQSLPFPFLLLRVMVRLITITGIYVTLYVVSVHILL